MASSTVEQAPLCAQVWWGGLKNDAVKRLCFKVRGARGKLFEVIDPLLTLWTESEQVQDSWTSSTVKSR